MTSAPITDVGVQIPYMQDTGNVKTSDKAAFMGTLKNAIENQAGNIGAVSDVSGNMSVAEPKKTVDDRAVDRTSNSSSTKDDYRKDNSVKNDIDKGGKSVAKKDEVDPETASEVIDSAKEIVKKIADSMNVSEEDVLNAMQSLGFTMIDLLDASNMTDIVTELSGIQDVMGLVTDENLYQTLGELQDFVDGITQDLMEELDLSQEALDEVLTQTEELLQHSVDEIGIQINDVDESPALEGMKDFKTTVSANGEEVAMNVKVDDTTGAQTITYQSSKAETHTGDSSKDDKPSNGEANHNEASFLIQNEQVNNNIDMTSGEQISAFSTRTQEIADQIMESIRTNIKPEITELEMNLHPASLGNVRINLTSVNGQITAQFLAQNETVRAAIESQVVQLTNQLEEQGVKIEAVEVTLASHQFESNSNQSNTGSEQSEREASKPKAGRIRKLDMSLMGDDEELEMLDESDRIAADMMARNGNTVDYMA